MKFALTAATTGLLLAAGAAHGAVVYIDREAATAAPTAWHAGVAGQPYAVPAAASAPPPGSVVQHRYRMSTVPEQSTSTMMLIGLGLLGLYMNRQQQEEKFSAEEGSSSLE